MTEEKRAFMKETLLSAFRMPCTTVEEAKSRMDRLMVVVENLVFEMPKEQEEKK